MATIGHKLLGEHLYENLWLSQGFPGRALERAKEFDLSGDVLMASYPKTGSTWLNEIVWLIANNGDCEAARQEYILNRIKVLELMWNDEFAVDQLMKEDPPRYIKSHLPARFFEKQLSKDNAKFIVLIRNPKDTLVSFYHFYRMCDQMGNFKGSWGDFFELYKQKHLFYGDYFDWYMEWLPYLDQANVKLVKYEDLKLNLSDSIKSLAAFLGKSLPESQLAKMVTHLQFDSMKDNEMTNYSFLPGFQGDISPFMRKGVIGDWKTHFSQAQSELVDTRYHETLYKSGINFDWE